MRLLGLALAVLDHTNLRRRAETLEASRQRADTGAEPTLLFRADRTWGALGSSALSGTWLLRDAAHSWSKHMLINLV